MVYITMKCAKHGRVPRASTDGQRGTCTICRAERRATPARVVREQRTAASRRRIGSTQNPPRGPLSQGGDT